ncbi:MAG: sigma-70 family RNA polymerase sigma factor [Opitutaceae bacterium]
MNDDAILLRRYTEEGSESAFAELVRRHVDLVYGAALRRTGGDAHRAGDVAQQVFTTLARQARKLARHPSLSGWLHTATRNAALNLMISEQRRKTREREVQTLELTVATGEPAPDWDRLRPVLDTAIDELAEADRAAVVLRFLEQRPFAEIGAALHVTEDAARVRTQRALDKLRAGLARHGITSTSAALAALVAGQPAISAPAGLAASLASTAVASVATGAGLAGTTLALFMNLKIASSLVLTAVVAFGSGIYLGLDRANQTPLPPLPETPQHSKTIAALRRDNATLKVEIDRLNATNATLTTKLATPPTPPPVASAPAPQSTPQPARTASDIQRAMLNNLRQISAARDQFQLENGRPPALDELVGDTKYVKRLRSVDGETYNGVSLLPSQLMTAVTPNGVTVTFDPTGPNTTRPERTPEEIQAAEAYELAMERFVQRVGGPERMKQLESTAKTATQAYRAAHNGQQPLTPEGLIPYFATPQEGADFVEALEMQKEIRKALGAGKQ